MIPSHEHPLPWAGADYARRQRSAWPKLDACTALSAVWDKIIHSVNNFIMIIPHEIFYGVHSARSLFLRRLRNPKIWMWGADHTVGVQGSNLRGDYLRFSPFGRREKWDKFIRAEMSVVDPTEWDTI